MTLTCQHHGTLHMTSPGAALPGWFSSPHDPKGQQALDTHLERGEARLVLDG